MNLHPQRHRSEWADTQAAIKPTWEDGTPFANIPLRISVHLATAGEIMLGMELDGAASTASTKTKGACQSNRDDRRD